MEEYRLDYSSKNIPTPSNKSYLKVLLEKLEGVLVRMRWRAYHFDLENTHNDTYNPRIKSRIYPLRFKELDKFEADALNLLTKIKFRNRSNKFQTKLKSDIKKIKDSDKTLIFSDKTRNIYELTREHYDQLLDHNVTQKYLKTNIFTYNDINTEARIIAHKLKVDSKLDILAKRNAFITVKDHKPDYKTNPKCRLLNPAKTELGLVSKYTLSRVNAEVRTKTKLRQWVNSHTTIDWFNAIDNKHRHRFTEFDIIDFYPSISETLLKDALEFARQHTTIKDLEVQTILHARRTLLFTEGSIWVKCSDPSGAFDVSMGAFDSAEICDLVGLYLLDRLGRRFPKVDFGLYKDDGLALTLDMDGQTLDRLRKDITTTFQNLGLNITITTNLTSVNFLDSTLDLASGLHRPYNKPNDNLTYINTSSCHPPSIIKNLVSNIGRRISRLSSNIDIFNHAAPHYNNALAKSGFKDKITYTPNNAPPRHNNRTKRRRNITWFTPPIL